MAISAKDVAALRTKTGCGMMECKKALTEANGDFDAAIKLLREKGLSVAAKKADRIAAEGIVDIMVSDDGATAAIIEVNSETDFVAKNATFVAFVKDILKTILKNRPENVEKLLAMNLENSDLTVEAALKDKIFTIGENMNIRRFEIVDGVLSTYIHGHGAIGVVVSFDADDSVVAKDGFKEFAKNIALQVAALPTPYISKESVPASVIEEEKEILMQQIKNDPKAAGKPEKVLNQMINGRLGKFYEQNCLLEQGYVKEDNMKVSAYIQASEKEFGGAITVAKVVRFEKGEGIQKRDDNFADEIAQLVNGK